jgi:hypothetical protein
LRAGWFWPLVLLALPNCAFQTGGLQAPQAFDPGTNPADAIMCDIRVPVAPGTDCATDQQTFQIQAMSSAAVNLNLGQGNNTALDYSADALNACQNLPRIVTFQGNFPDGKSVCINCNQQIGAGKKFADANAACRAQCVDLVNQMDKIPLDMSADQFCSAPGNAQVSTNFTATFGDCATGACNNPNFHDLRRDPEDVKWTDLTPNASATGSTLTRTLSGDDKYTEGGASDTGQLITNGDGWIQFSVGETNLGHAIGIAKDPGNVSGNFSDFAFAVLLDDDGFLYIGVDGVLVDGIPGNGTNFPGKAFATYTSGQEYRIHAVDQHDGTVMMSVTNLSSQCPSGQMCTENMVFTLPQNSPSFPAYPLRVEGRLKEAGASLVGVQLMRIKK